MKRIDVGLVATWTVIGACLVAFWLSLGYVVVEMLL